MAAQGSTNSSEIKMMDYCLEAEAGQTWTPGQTLVCGYWEGRRQIKELGDLGT